MRFTTLFSILALLVLTGCAGNQYTADSESTPPSTVDPIFNNVVTDAHGNPIISGNAEGVDLSDLSAGSEGDFVINVGNRILFATNKHSLTSDATTILRRQASWLRTHSNVVAVIEGHADERGPTEFNLALGARRADSVRDFLIAEGIDASRLDTISYGKERPVALGSYEGAWSENRRSVTNLQ